MTLSLYLTRQFSKWLLISVGVFGSIFALIDFLELLRRGSGMVHVSLSLILKMLLYRFPGFFQEILPFVVFFAAILCLWRLNKNSEIVVMRAAGVSIWQILNPLLAVALFIGIIDIFVVNPVSSRLLERFFYLEDIYFNFGKSSKAASTANGLWFRELNTDGGYTVIRADHFDMRQSIFTNIQVMNFDADEHFVSRADGDIGILKAGTIEVENGWFVNAFSYPKKFQSRSLETQLSTEKIKDSFLNPKTLSVFQLRTYGQNLEKSGLSAKKYFLRWHSLIAKILWLVVMVVFASSFTLSYMRSGKTVKLIVIGVSTAFVLYFLKDVTYAMGTSGQIPILVAAWIPTFVTGLLSLTRLLYVEEG